MENPSTKICTKCGKTKNNSEFHRDISRKDLLFPQCKICKQESTRSEVSHLKSVYGGQKKSSKNRRMAAPNYTFERLNEWANKNGYYALWCQWNWSGFERQYSPSPDRIDDYKSYTLDNLRLITFRDNCKKAYSDQRNGINNKNSKPIRQLLNGEEISKFYSLAQAERETGVGHSHISRCCTGKRKTAGGFMWEHLK
jgi:hypothetical protein